MQPISLLTSLYLFWGSALYAQNADNAYVPDHLIARLRDDLVINAVQKDGIAELGLPAIDALNHTYGCVQAIPTPLTGRNAPIIYTLHFAKGIDIPKAIKAYMATGLLKYAEPDYYGNGDGTTAVQPNDPKFTVQWSLKNDGTGNYPLGAKANADISITDAWAVETGDTNVIVAIVDSGCKLDHPDFSGRFWKNYKEIPGNNLDDDNNGYIDDVDGYNFAYDNNNVSDDFGHGTHVTSILGANGNNGTMITGIDWHCKLMILKALDAFNIGQVSWLNNSIAYASKQGARIINLSLGNYPYSLATQDIINNAYANNVTIVASMGNSASHNASYPGGYTHVIAVGATNPADNRAEPFCGAAGSNIGEHISVVAPGDEMPGLSFYNDTLISVRCGTSQAAPHVAGLASLLLAQDPTRTPDTIKRIIEMTADDMVGNPKEDIAGFDIYYGHGRINANRALHFPDAPTSVGRLTKNDISIFPNPCKDKLNIRTNQSLTYRLLNTVGETAATGTLSVGNSNINVCYLNRGIYFLVLNTGANSTVHKVLLQ